MTLPFSLSLAILIIALVLWFVDLLRRKPLTMTVMDSIFLALVALYFRA